MSASKWEIWRYVYNITQRAAYGVNGKKHYNLQKTRIQNMVDGGNGGKLNNSIMIDTSSHEGSIRELHFSDWSDTNFREALDLIEKWEDTGYLPDAPAKDPIDVVGSVIDAALVLFSRLERDSQVDALNSLAERLGVMGDIEDETE